MDRLADTPCNMDVGSRDGNLVVRLVDIHDALQRMLAFLSLFRRTRQCQQFVAVLLHEVAFEGHVPGRKVVIDAMAGGAQRLVRLLGSSCLLPVAVVENEPALRTYSGFRQLRLGPIRILVFFLELSVEPFWLIVAKTLLHLFPPFPCLGRPPANGV